MRLAPWAPALLLVSSPPVSATILAPHSLQLRHEHPQPRHEDLHPAVRSGGHHAAPLLELNETELLQHHAPDPLSYWAHDFQLDDSPNVRGLMALHVFGMTFAFFGCLPLAIVLRAVRHPLHGPAVLAFVLSAFLSSAAGSLYKKLTGDLYEGSVHGRHGYVLLAFVSILAILDALSFVQRAVVFLRGPDRKNFRLLWRTVLLNQDARVSNEYTSLVHDEPDEYDEAKLTAHTAQEPNESRRHPARFPDPIDTAHANSAEWVNQQEDWPQSATSHHTLVNHSYHNSRHSIASDDTLNIPIFSRSDSNDIKVTQERHSWLATIRRLAMPTADRILLLVALMQFLTGTTAYTGICRQNYINGCLAHLIKGSIFWCYGLLTFGRYLGAWADLGWAWNRLPSRRAHNIPSAEMVECAVIFLYGITNTWMERFGAAPGSAFTTKQVQHISIAVMFWFAGLLGCALESKAFRRWLAAPAFSVTKADDTIAQPPSYTGSFNPFPALVIGVTGAAMSAHHQTYLFSVQVHALWGFLLTGFAVLRFLTYFFLWLRPPHSVLPSRPPTEALASFFLASGGLVFSLSTEQITYAAMRQGHDDMMLFFNFAVAVTSLAFCWLLFFTAFKGWLTSRAVRSARPQTFSRRVVFDADVRVT